MAVNPQLSVLSEKDRDFMRSLVAEKGLDAWDVLWKNQLTPWYKEAILSLFFFSFLTYTLTPSLPFENFIYLPRRIDAPQTRKKKASI